MAFAVTLSHQSLPAERGAIIKIESITVKSGQFVRSAKTFVVIEPLMDSKSGIQKKVS